MLFCVRDALPENDVAAAAGLFPDCHTAGFAKDLDAAPLVSRLVTYTSGGSAPLACARLRLNSYPRGGGWDWHVDLPVACDDASLSTSTLLLYLTDCRRGGATEFLLPATAAVAEGQDGVSASPQRIGDSDRLRVLVEPRRGRAVLFSHDVRHRSDAASQPKSIAQAKVRLPPAASSAEDAPSPGVDEDEDAALAGGLFGGID